MTSPAPTSGSILITDDDPDILEVLSMVFEGTGCAVLVARNGQEALAQLRQGVRPSLILLDLMMPVMNGWEFRAEQLRDPALATIPVVVMTGFSKTIDRARRVEADVCLQKPIDLDGLLVVARRFLPELRMPAVP